MYQTAKRQFLRLCRATGLFRISRRLVASRLLILCYHGFDLGGESRFRPKLFMTGETFAARLRALRERKAVILGLSEALTRLGQGTLPANSVVITIDDGFHSVYAVALPILEKFQVPATVYVTSYHALKATPVFRLVVQYMFWKTERSVLECGEWTWLAEGRSVALTPSAKRALEARMIGYGEAMSSEDERQTLLAQLGDRLGVDYAELASRRSFTLMTTDEIARASRRGMDVQLHTHRHRFPAGDVSACAQEIGDNRAALAPHVAHPLVHFCYPSGEWSPTHWPVLQAAGIASATTCDRGFNSAGTPPLGLKRFLDGENVSMIEFEAELSGFAHFLRMLVHRGRVGGRAGD
jgi:peptidoglycan/xylan/chitin deacetylase (PgdA/CDA1 family)